MSASLKPSDQFKARGLSGRYVVMIAYPDGTPVPDRAAHGLRCSILDEDWTVEPGSPLFGTAYAPVPVEEVPDSSWPCRKCGGGAYRPMAQR